MTDDEWAEHFATIKATMTVRKIVTAEDVDRLINALDEWLAKEVANQRSNSHGDRVPTHCASWVSREITRNATMKERRNGVDLALDIRTMVRRGMASRNVRGETEGQEKRKKGAG